MSNKQLRNALFARYKVTARRRWYVFLLIAFYVFMGIFSEFEYLEKKEVSSDMLIMVVFIIIGVSSLSIIETTQHEKCQYIVPFSFEERKRYYLIGVLSNFTITLVFCLLFIIATVIIDKDFGMRTIQLFALGGLPYLLVIALQKINMFKGKKKKDDPKLVYISWAVGVVIGILISISLTYFEYILKNRALMNSIIVIANVSAFGRLCYGIMDIIRKDTDYENVKIKQMLIIKKMM